jgi:hypothetical protein
MSMRLPSGRGLIRIALGCCIFFTAAFPETMAADPLKYTDPEVTAYVKALGQFRDRYLAAVNAAKHGDDREMKRMDGELPEWQEKAIRLVDKLEPSETKRFTEFVTQCGQTMMDAAYGFTRAHTD